MDAILASSAPAEESVGDMALRRLPLSPLRLAAVEGLDPPPTILCTASPAGPAQPHPPISRCCALQCSHAAGRVLCRRERLPCTGQRSQGGERPGRLARCWRPAPSLLRCWRPCSPLPALSDLPGRRRSGTGVSQRSGERRCRHLHSDRQEGDRGGLPVPPRPLDALPFLQICPGSRSNGIRGLQDGAGLGSGATGGGTHSCAAAATAAAQGPKQHAIECRTHISADVACAAELAARAPALGSATTSTALTAAAAVDPTLPSPLYPAHPPLFQVDFGEQVVLVGNAPELGNWQLDHAPNMTWSEGDTWVATITLPPGTDVEYKFVLRSPTT